MTIENNHLMILEVEKERAEIQLKDQLSSIRRMIDNLELKLENGDHTHLYTSDGLQGNGGNIDIYLNQLVTYNRAIELFKKQLNVSD